MKKLAIAIVVLLAMLLVIGALAYHYRLELMLAAAPRIADLRDPIDAHHDIVMEPGPGDRGRAAGGAPAQHRRDRGRRPGLQRPQPKRRRRRRRRVAHAPTSTRSRATASASRAAYAGNAHLRAVARRALTGRYPTRFGFEFTPTPAAFRLARCAARTRWPAEPRLLPERAKRCDPDGRDRHAADRDHAWRKSCSGAGYHTAAPRQVAPRRHRPTFRRRSRASTRAWDHWRRIDVPAREDSAAWSTRSRTSIRSTCIAVVYRALLGASRRRRAVRAAGAT